MSDLEYTDADAPQEDGPYQAPLHDSVAEQSVLGGMMLSRRAVDDVIDALVPSDFYQPKHELIARAIGTLASRNEPVDALTVTEELRRTDKLTQAGGAAYLHELTAIVPTAANAGYYAKTVHELAVKRRLAAAGTRIVAMGNASEGDVETLVENARLELDQVSTGRRVEVKSLGDTFNRVIEDLAELPTFTPTPWTALDRWIGGFAPGALYVIGARPGQGKSIAALQIAATLAHEGMVAYSSLEMTEAELQKRLIAQYGPVHMTSLRSHRLSEDEWKKVVEAKLRVQGAPIFVDDSAGATMGDVRAHARAVARKGKLAGIVIDYLQLVNVEDRGRRERREVVDEISRQAKQLAKDFNVPVIAAAQLKRAGMRKGLPTLDDLREAGGIEQDADVVMLLHRDREKKPHDIQWVVGKNRHGEAGKFTLSWEAHYARFQDRGWTPLYEDDE